VLWGRVEAAVSAGECEHGGGEDMRNLLEALFALVLGIAGIALVIGLTALPWALGCAYMLGWL